MAEPRGLPPLQIVQERLGGSEEVYDLQIHFVDPRELVGVHIAENRDAEAVAPLW